MPSFEEFILAAPLNFPRGCRTINNMQSSNPSQLETLCLEVKQKKLDNLGTDAFETLQYIFASISKSLPPPSISQVASVLDTSTYLSRDSITAIASVASSEEDNSLVSNVCCLFYFVVQFYFSHLLYINFLRMQRLMVSRIFNGKLV